MSYIYHLVHEKQWNEVNDGTYYSPPSLETEGFIHCSTADQILGSANRFYAGSSSLLILIIDIAKVTARVVFEDLHGGGKEFPHIYGKLPISAVQKVVPLKPNVEGKFTELPPELT